MFHRLAQIGVYDPDTGEKVHSVDMPVKRPSACAFGGPDLTQLYITTIQAGPFSWQARWRADIARRLPCFRRQQMTDVKVIQSLLKK